MVYGPFSLVDAAAAELTFQLWLDTEKDYDQVYWLASTDNAAYHGYAKSGNTGGWVVESLDLTDVPTLGNLVGEQEVWIALVFISDASIHLPEGVYVDDILLRKLVQ